jgi:hypothetical protein
MNEISTSTATVYTTSSVHISWDINAVRVYPEHQDQINVVSEIDWTLTGSKLNENAELIQASITGTETINYNPNASFIDYNSLTETKLVNWLNQSHGHDHIIELINNVKQKLSIKSIELPWSQQ